MTLLFISLYISKIIIIVLSILGGLFLLWVSGSFFYAIWLENKMYRDWNKSEGLYVPPEKEDMAFLSGKYNFQYVPVNKNFYKIIKFNRTINVYPETKEWDEEGTHKFGTFEKLEMLIKDLFNLK